MRIFSQWTAKGVLPIITASQLPGGPISFVSRPFPIPHHPLHLPTGKVNLLFLIFWSRMTLRTYFSVILFHPHLRDGQASVAVGSLNTAAVDSNTTNQLHKHTHKKKKTLFNPWVCNFYRFWMTNIIFIGSLYIYKYSSYSAILLCTLIKEYMFPSSRFQ